MKKAIQHYQALNALAEPDGCVIFGGAEDRSIPLGELKETFDLQGRFYDRSFDGLALSNAADLYDRCVASLSPREIYLHIGQNDVELFLQDAAAFNQRYALLVRHIRAATPKCDIAIISLSTPKDDPVISQLNSHLEEIARNEALQFCDISKPQVWDPRQTKEVLSFLYSIGFVHPLKQKLPMQELARLLFSFGAGHT